MLNLAFCLMGATASGKTSLACELIKQFPFEIVSVDSTLIYREMNIGSAKPTADELLQAPHHLIDMLNPNERYSVARFCNDVTAVNEAIRQRGNIPLLVGGTMMYFQALQQGLSNLPEADVALRKMLLQQAKQQGWAYLYQQLLAVDPAAAAKIHPHDKQRIQRALEVYQLTGKPFSAFESETPNATHRFINLILMPQQRAWLHARIATRFEHMLKAGLIMEVEQLLQKWQLSLACPAMRSVGYRQVGEYLTGAYDDAELLYRGIVATRQLAKRQLTWLRHWPAAHYFACENPQVLSEIVAVVQEILDNTG